MIITKTPLRISFVGGGSDMPAFFHEEPGAVVSASIDKYVYVTVSESFSGRIRAAYRQIEEVDRAGDLQHDLMREALGLLGLRAGFEIHSIADVPGGTGLGSSSAFTVGLLRALAASVDSPATLASLACKVEIERCKHPIGVQDQYAAAYGGINLLRFAAERVEVAAIPCDAEALTAHTLLLYTGQIRDGDAGQQIARQKHDHGDIQQLARCARLFAQHLRDGDLHKCGPVLDFAWEIKRRFASNPQIDRWYRVARQAGAWGGKLCGAGGGGFMLFLAPPAAHSAIVAATGLRHVPVRLGVPGCEVIYADHEINRG